MATLYNTNVRFYYSRSVSLGDLEKSIACAIETAAKWRTDYVPVNLPSELEDVSKLPHKTIKATTYKDRYIAMAEATTFARDTKSNDSVIDIARFLLGND